MHIEYSSLIILCFIVCCLFGYCIYLLNRECRKKYIIEKELMVGKCYWVIYQLTTLTYSGKIFIERWNTPETANMRLKELNERK